jgi:hypothetical protein
MREEFGYDLAAQCERFGHVDKQYLDRRLRGPVLLEQVTRMNFDKISELCRGAEKYCGERLPYLHGFTELRPNEVNEVWLVRNEPIVRVNAAAPGARIVSQTRSQTTSRRSAKGS